MLEHHLKQLEYAQKQEWFTLFIANIQKSSWSNNGMSYECSIVNSFDWTATKEGHAYWDDIDNKLVKLFPSSSLLHTLQNYIQQNYSNTYPELFI